MVATPPPTTLWVRDIGSNVNDAKTTFSSWDGCMQKDYCKWPVIAIIVVVSLIVLSIISCIVRCCCCGLECCCGCFSCFNRCCPSPRGGKKRSKYADGPPPGFQPSPFQGYQSQPQPNYGPTRAFEQPAQFATFDTSKKGANSGAINADSLPAMPSWENAQSRRVEDTSHEEVEMDRLGDEQKAPMLAHQAPSPVGGHGGFGGVAAAGVAPYQDRVARNGGDLGNPYGQDNHDGVQQAYGAAASYNTQQNPYGSHQNPYSPPSPYDQQPHYDGTAYGVVGHGQMSPPSQATPYGQAGHPGHQNYEQQTTYGIASSRSPVSPMSPQQRYGPTSSPPAQSGGIPASLVPARGNTPQAQQQNYQSYSSYGPSETSSSYTAYGPSSSSHTATGFPPMRQPAQQHSDTWRDL